MPPLSPTGAGLGIGFRLQNSNRLIRKFGMMEGQIDPELSNAVTESLILVESEAIRLIRFGYYQPAIDTGRLRSSITHERDSDGMGGKVGTNVFYAPFVHEGTTRMEERPFLVDSLRNKKDLIVIRLGASVKKVLSRQTIF